MWTVRTKMNGIKILMKPYQANIVNKLISDKEPIGSSAMFYYLEENMGDKAPSRASVINFLNELSTHEYASYFEKSGKGGFHRLYSCNLTKETFSEKMIRYINRKLMIALEEIFP